MMKQHPSKIQALLCGAAVSLTVGLCQAQQPPAVVPQTLPGGVDAEANGAGLASPLGVRQQRVKRMMVDLEKKFTDLATRLGEEAPEQAEKLEEAFKQSKELLLMQRMDKIIRLLNDTKLESANEEQQQIIGDLETLIDLLLYEESEREKLQREIEKLESWKKALDTLINEEAKLQEESEKLDNPEAAKEAVEAKLSDAKDLIKAQKKVLEATKADDGKDVDALDKLADEQAELRKATEALAEALDPDSDQASAEDEESQAAQAMKQAGKSQRSSEKQLASGKSQDAGKSQESALQQLKKAAEALEKERERLNQLGEQTEKNLVDQQEATSEKTGELAEEMGKDAEVQESETSPQESVQNAQQQMDQASQQLSQSQPGKASQNQQQAKEELEKAREEVERQLNEKRDQAQQEQIAQLEEAFKKMLQRQQQVSAGTRELAVKRGGDDKSLKRRDRITLRELAKEERGLEEDAKSAEDLLLDDGTSVVFRDIVGYLQLEIANVSELMEKRQTGELVQSAHLEIETTLQELIAALENSGAGEQQQQEPGQQQPGQQQPGQQQQQRENLFPPIAELKLLKFTQERVNRRATALEQVQANPELEEVLNRQLNSVASMQNKLTNMTRQLATKLEKPSPMNVDSID